MTVKRIRRGQTAKLEIRVSRNCLNVCNSTFSFGFINPIPTEGHF